MTNIMDSISNVLGIDKVNMDGKLICIEEQHDTNANFVLSSIISSALKRNYEICFVLFHNTMNHYHNVGMKFGYNLTLLREKGKVTVIEPMKIVASNMECIYEQTANNLVHDIFVIIKTEYDKIIQTNERVIIIIDDLSHIYNFGCNLKESMYYMRYLRSLIECYNMSQLCVVMHTYKDENSFSNVLAHGLKYTAHLFIKTEPLETGYSSDASGNITINWRMDDVRIKYNWPESKYYYMSISQLKIIAYMDQNYWRMCTWIINTG